MSTSATVRTGLPALMQDHLSSRLVSTLVDQMPWMLFLLGKDGNKDGAFGLGRPRSGQLYTGMPMTKARKEQVLGTDKYMPAIQTSLPSSSNGKVLGMYDTMPTVPNWNSDTPAGRISRPFFKWVERADPIMVPKKEIRRTQRQAGSGASAAIGDLFRFEAENVLTTQVSWWNDQFWGAYTVAPTNVDSDVWDSPYSIAAALKADNVYGGVDRATTANSYWRGNYDTTHRAADLAALIHQANYTNRCATKGQGISLLICGLDLFPQFIAQADALKGQVIYDGKLPGFGEFGFTKEVIRYRNTYVVLDARCPSVTRGDSTNALVGLNLDTWTVAVSPDANFTVDEVSDLTKTEGGKDALKSQIRTELIVACEAPSVNQYWTDVG